MKNAVLFVLTCLLYLQPSFAQNSTDVPPHRTCGANHYVESMMSDPDFARFIEEHQNMVRYISSQERQSAACGTPLIIPVAIHYNNSNGGGITQANEACLIAAAQTQIDQLNLDFSSCNANVSNFCDMSEACPSLYDEAAMPDDGACIQFCIGDQNLPNGEDNIGNLAITYGDYLWSGNNSDTGNNWDGFLNIFVSDDPPPGFSSILGVAPLSGASNPSGDGVYVIASAFGGTGDPNGCTSGAQIGGGTPYNGGATLTHEIGHYFGLPHTFDGDGVADTPALNSPNYGCPTTNTGSCTVNNLANGVPQNAHYFNFMDYVNDACMFMFTAGQVAVMQNTIAAQGVWATNSVSCYDQYQSGATTYNSCQGACVAIPPVADFNVSPDPINVCAGGTVFVTDASLNDPTAWTWTFSGAGVSPTMSTTQNPAITVASSGTLTVTLTATNAEGSDMKTSTYTVTVDNNCTDGCINLTNVDIAGDTPIVYASDGTGLLSGNNNYADESKTEFFDLATLGYAAPVTLTEINLQFATTGNPTGTVNVVVWAADGAGGAPGTVLYTIPLPVSTIVADVTASNLTSIDLASAPITLTGNFYIGISGLGALGDGTTDAVGLVTNTNGETNPGTGWEQFSDGTWTNYNGANSWGLNVSHYVFAEIIPQAPTAGFDIPVDICAGANIILSNTSTNGDTYAWTFASGAPATASVANPSVSFATPGTYAIDLSVTNACGETDMISQNITIIDCSTNEANCPSYDPATASAIDICDGGSTTITATVVACDGGSTGAGNLIVDGSFEIGSPSTDWTENSAAFGTPLCTAAGCGGGAANTGDWFIWGGGVAAGDNGFVEQSVTFPTGGVATLEFYINFPCGTAGNTVTVVVDGNTELTITADDTALCDLGYQLVSVPLNAYADGAAHTVQIAFTTVDGQNFFIDDISMLAPGTVPSSTVTVTWMEDGTIIGTPVSQACGDISETFALTHSGTTCAPEVVTLSYSAACDDNASIISTGTFDVTIYPLPDALATYWSVADGECDGPVVSIDPGCESVIFVTPVAGSPTFPVNPGDNGTLDYDVVYNVGPCCADTFTEVISDAASGTAVDAEGTCDPNVAGSRDIFPITFTTAPTPTTVAASGVGAIGEFCVDVTASTNTAGLLIALNNPTNATTITIWQGGNFGGNDGNTTDTNVSLCIDGALLSGFFVGEATNTWEIILLDAACAFGNPTTATLNSATISINEAVAGNTCELTATAAYDCIIECPVVADVTASTTDACVGDFITLSAVLDNADLGTVNWTLPDNSVITSATTNVIAATTSGCTETVDYAYEVICNDNQSVVTSGVLSVNIYPAITATVTTNDCDNSISMDCPEFTATWTDSQGGSGNGLTYTAATATAGLTTYTITNTAAPAACASATFDAAYNCAAACPAFTTASISSNAICNGETVDLTAVLSDATLATITWTLPDATTLTGNAITVTPSITGCTETLDYTYEVVCNDNLSVLGSGTLSVTVYPAITATATPGACTASISQDCLDYTATWIDGDGISGTGFSYTANSNTIGTVTFTVENANAPASCNAATFTADYDCPANCPTFVSDNASAVDVCDGESVTLTATTSDASLATVSWSGPAGTFTGESWTFMPTASGACTETQTYSYSVICTENQAILENGNFVITVSPAITASATNGTCTASISQDCADYTATWIDEDGLSGNGFSYTAASNTVGTVTFTVTNPNATATCSSAAFTASYDCPADCPTFTSADANATDFCDGDAVTLTAVVSDASLATINWNGPAGTFTGDVWTFNAASTDCVSAQDYSYEVICNETSGVITSGMLSINVYGAITANPTNGGCNASISQDCPDYTATWVDGDGLSGSGFSYTAATGAIGTVTFSVSSPNAPTTCNMATFTATYDCPVGCPTLIDATASATSLCDGDAVTLTANISDATAATVTWTGTGTSFTGDTWTFNAASADCVSAQDYSYEVVCDATSTVIGSGTLSISVYGAITATATNGACVASISQDCADYTATWVDGDGNSGNGFSYTAATGAIGTVTFSVSNPNAPATCNAATFTADYDCPVGCPTFIDATASATSVCDGDAVTLTTNISDASLATVNWTGASTFTGDTWTFNAASADCVSAQDYNYEVICNETSGVIGSGTISITVYGAITATATSGACTASISQDCADYTATWVDGDGNSGNGFSYTAATGAIGTVTFSVSNPNAPATCTAATFTADYDCPVGCPTFIDATASATSVCDGDVVTLTANISDASLATVNWTGASTFTGDTWTFNAASADCVSEQDYSYEVICNETSGVIGSGTISISVYGAITATATNGACAASISQDCADYTATWVDGDGNSGNGFSYTAVAGAIGTVTFSVSNPNAPATCNAATFTADYDCPVDCPTLNGASATANDFCEGEEIVLTADISDPNGVTVNWTGPAGTFTGTAWTFMAASSNGCTDMQTYNYEVICNANSTVLGTGIVTLSVYPTITATPTNDGCSASVSQDCPEFSFAWTDGDGVMGAGSTYNAASGLAGNVTFTVSNIGAPAACSSATFTAAYDCPGNCPTVVSSDALDACDGDQATVSITLSDNTLATVNWSGAAGTSTGESWTFAATSASGCTEVQTYTYEIVCSDTGTTVSTGTVNVTVYPIITAVTTDGGCSASITQACPEFTATWVDTDGNTGAGFVYTAGANVTGTVSFTLNNNNAPADCSSAGTFDAIYGCTCDAPNVIANNICNNLGDTEFYIDVTVSFGSGTSYTVSNNGGAPNAIINTDGGTTQIGPFANGTAVDVTVTDDNDASCVIIEPGIIGNCSTDCLLTAVANSNQGDNGGIGTYYYNSVTIDIMNGAAPYTFTWDKMGYVRHTVLDDAVAVIYSDEATWTVTITDADGCSTIVMHQQQNLPLNIVDYTVGADTGTNTGSIDIMLVGGSGNYTYQWAGPDNYTNTVEDPSGLVAGWYTVTVSDTGTGETTIGWYWVEPARRGRGKLTDADIMMQTAPNPFSTTTTIAFSLPIAEQVQVQIFDISGKQISTLFNGAIDAEANYSISFDANGLPSGMYICKLSTSTGVSKFEKLVIAK